MADIIGAAILIAVAWCVIRSAVRSAVVSAIKSEMPMPGDWYELEDDGKWHRRRANDQPLSPTDAELRVAASHQKSPTPP